LRVALKLTLTLVAVGFVIFGLYGAYELHAERDNLRRVIEQEIRLLGRSLEVAFENALQDREVADIAEMVESLKSLAPSIDILVYDLGGRLLTLAQDVYTASPVYESARQTAMNSRETVLLFNPPDDPSQVVLAAPLIGDDGSLFGALVIVRPLLDLQRALRERQRETILTIVLFALIAAALGLVLGASYIGRPLSRMAAAMREVRSGNLELTLPIYHKDEVGAVAAEFNVMVRELREARRRLEEEAEERRQLQRTLQEADKLIRIGQLAAGLAHEIGSPLQILNGRARALLARAHDPDEVRRNVAILIAQSDRITRIVEQLLRFARRRPVSTGSVDPRSAINDVLTLLQHEAQRRGVALTFSWGQDVPAQPADTDRIQQIVLNLVTNALAATPAGGRVSVSVEASKLVAAEEGKELPAIRLTVADTGSGMPAEVRERIFEPFFTTRDAEGGTGLGLAVVKSLVSELGGTISVESEPGVGSRFTIDLPLRDSIIKREVS
jgi:signal transduction histidine kinase